MAPRSLNKLSARQVQLADIQDKDYKLSDGGGLYLFVRKTGSKSWVFRYTKPTTGKVTNLGVGPYPTYSLAEARELCAKFRRQVTEGIDPKLQREQDKAVLSEEQNSSLERIAEMWLESKSDSIKAKTLEGHVQKLRKYVYPALGNIPVTQITAPQAIAALREPERQGKLETVKRTCALLNSVMTFAVNYGLIHHNPLSGIAAVFKKPKTQNLPALSPGELPELMQKMSTSNMYFATRCLFEFQLHTMVRPNEAAAARWDEIDLVNKVWTIPAERMKMERDHRVPLSDQVISILEAVKPISGHREHLFPSVRAPSKHTDSETLNRALRRAGFVNRTCAHGLRSLASTTLNEAEFNRDVIEAALAHGDDDRIRGAYNRSDWFDLRRTMMEWWSKHIVENSAVKVSLAV